MKSKFIYLSLTVLLAAGILNACNSPGNKTDASQGYKDSVAQSASVMSDTVNTAKTDWEKFKADANAKIRQNEDSIRVFKKRIEKEDVKIKAKYHKLITKLEEKNNDMKAKLTDYKEEGKDKLEIFRTDFNNRMDTIDMNIKHFFDGKNN